MYDPEDQKMIFIIKVNISIFYMFALSSLIK